MTPDTCHLTLVPVATDLSSADSHPGPGPVDPDPECEVVDPRAHVAALIELCKLGWHLTEMRPDRYTPRLWRVVIRRYDGDASISVTDADPDDALTELIRYARVDDTEEP